MKYAEYVITIHIDESKLQDIEVENYLDTYITEMEDVLKGYDGKEYSYHLRRLIQLGATIEVTEK